MVPGIKDRRSVDRVNVATVTANVIKNVVSECGQVLASSTNSSDNGTTIPRGYPWHVAIYRSSNLKRFICSGSLLSERIVLTGKRKCF